MGDRFAELERARDAALAEAEAFRADLEPSLAASLRRGLERLMQEQAGHVSRLDEATRVALDDAMDRAIPAAVASVSERLRDPDLWLSPLVAPELAATSAEGGWPTTVPGWLAGLLGRGARARVGLGSLDDPGNRVWVAVSSAATSVDPVLAEFGFAPAHRRIGGGRFGVVPRTLPRLDPTGALQQHWKRYRAAYERYEALARVTG